MFQSSPWHQAEPSFQQGPHPCLTFFPSLSKLLFLPFSWEHTFKMSDLYFRVCFWRTWPETFTKKPCFLTFMCDFVLFSFINLVTALQILTSIFASCYFSMKRIESTWLIMLMNNFYLYSRKKIYKCTFSLWTNSILRTQNKNIVEL